MNVQRFTPANDREAAAIVKEAHAASQTLEIVSQGTKRDLGRPVKASAVLDVSALTGVLEYQPEELVLTARAATPICEIGALLASRKQMLPFEPGDWGPLFGAAPGRQTLAGAVAADVCGPRRVKSGGARDHVIGCRFINGDGEPIRAGGKVIKNVTGFDIAKLMCGAFGTLGVLAEITIRVLPRPAHLAALSLQDCTAEAGLRALVRAAGLAVEPTGLCFIPGELLHAFGLQQSGSRGAGLIRVEGTAAAIEEKIALLCREFRDMKSTVLDQTGTEALFRKIGEASPFASGGDLWRLCVPPACAANAVAEAAAPRWFADWGGALLWMEVAATPEFAQRLRRITAKFGGHATLFRATDDARGKIDVFEPQPPVRQRLTQGLKDAFDPARVLNPGRMYDYL